MPTASECRRCARCETDALMLGWCDLCFGCWSDFSWTADHKLTSDRILLDALEEAEQTELMDKLIKDWVDANQK